MRDDWSIYRDHRLETRSHFGINSEHLADVLPRVGSHPQSRVAELTLRRWLAAGAVAVISSNQA